MLSRAAFRLLLPAAGMRASFTPAKTLTTRNLALLSSSRPQHPRTSTLCSCGCGIHGIHTRGDRELVEFLQTEISEEKKNLGPSLPSSLDDFTVKTQAAELTLTKTFHDEKITVSLNVNHTVDSVDEPGQEQADVNLQSRPSFEIDIVVGSKTLSFTCSFKEVEELEAEEQSDIFGINELTIYEGEWSEATYCSSGDILDAVLYDLLMNMLEERGISNEFVEKVSQLCSSYEHSLYVNLLQQVENFVKRK